MAVYRLDVWTDDADTFVQWIREHVPESELVRPVGFDTVKSWYFKNVFSDKHSAEEFHRHWYRRRGRLLDTHRGGFTFSGIMNLLFSNKAKIVLAAAMVLAGGGPARADLSFPCCLRV